MKRETIVRFRRWIGVGTAALALSVFAGVASAQDWQTSGPDGWIENWLGLELVINTGGFNESATHDYISEGTGGKYTYESVSTQAGVEATKNMVVSLPDNLGGDLTWKVITIDTNDQNNMSTSWGLAPQDNITWHGILVLASPNDRTTTANFAHDDYAQVWLNGELVYDNSNWTGGVRNTNPQEITLNKGGNVLLFKCGESGGADYVNMHLDAGDEDVQILPTTDGKFFEFLSSVDVQPAGKLPTVWGLMKVLR